MVDDQTDFLMVWCRRVWVKIGYQGKHKWFFMLVQSPSVLLAQWFWPKVQSWFCMHTWYSMIPCYLMLIIVFQHKNHFLRVIPTNWHSIWYIYIYIHSYIIHTYSDILFGILFDFYSDALSAILSGILSDILFGRYSYILSGIISDILFDVYSFSLTVYQAFYLTPLLTYSIWLSVWHLALAVEVPQCPLTSGSRVRQYSLRSGACRWGPAVPTEILRSGSAHWDLELAVEVWLAVEVRQCPLRSGARGPLRCGSAHWALELAAEVRQCLLGSGACGWGGGGGATLW